MSHLETNASTSTGDNRSLALEGEQAHQARVLRGSGVVMDKVSSFVNWVSRHDGKNMNSRYQVLNGIVRSIELKGLLDRMAREVSRVRMYGRGKEPVKATATHQIYIRIWRGAARKAQPVRFQWIMTLYAPRNRGKWRDVRIG